MKTKIFILLALSALLSAGCGQKSTSSVPASANSPYNRKLQIGSQILNVEVVSSAADMAQGLSDRAFMQKDQGMLFDFGATTSPAFWMKDMKFNLDFIWIRNNKIISITEDAPAPLSSFEHLPLYYPPSPVDEVLEVNSGWAEKYKIKTGDEVRLNY